MGSGVLVQRVVTCPLFRWKGRWLEQLTGLYDVRARQWAPGVGSFTAIDEIHFHDRQSTLWGWPAQNPIADADPSGHQVVINPGPTIFILLSIWYLSQHHSDWFGPAHPPPQPPPPGPGGPGGGGGHGGGGGPYRTPGDPGPSYPEIEKCKGLRIQEMAACCAVACHRHEEPDPNKCPTPEAQEAEDCYEKCMDQYWSK